MPNCHELLSHRSTPRCSRGWQRQSKMQLPVHQQRKRQPQRRHLPIAVWLCTSQRTAITTLRLSRASKAQLTGWNGRTTPSLRWKAWLPQLAPTKSLRSLQSTTHTQPWCLTRITPPPSRSSQTRHSKKASPSQRITKFHLRQSSRSRSRSSRRATTFAK